MKISILTLFPDMFTGPFGLSMVKKAQEKKLLEIQLVHIRDFGNGTHKVVDDTPYGGGLGMVLKVDVMDRALQATKDPALSFPEQKIILLDPRGKPLTQSLVHELSITRHLILVCGHYEGFDERIRTLVDQEISLGDFIVTGGEIPAMVITDAVTRLIPGFFKEGVTHNESFSQNLLEYPQYTTPQTYNNLSVPDVLLSGNHKNIQAWKEENARNITHRYRPDLLKR